MHVLEAESLQRARPPKVVRDGMGLGQAANVSGVTVVGRAEGGVPSPTPCRATSNRSLTHSMSVHFYQIADLILMGGSTGGKGGKAVIFLFLSFLILEEQGMSLFAW